MSRRLSQLFACALIALSCLSATFSQQNNKKVTVTLVRWPYT
jgi:putative cell wall-binding protein